LHLKRQISFPFLALTLPKAHSVTLAGVRNAKLGVIAVRVVCANGQVDHGDFLRSFKIVL